MHSSDHLFVFALYPHQRLLGLSPFQNNTRHTDFEEVLLCCLGGEGRGVRTWPGLSFNIFTVNSATLVFGFIHSSVISAPLFNAVH